MRFLNFSLSTPSHATVLRGLDNEWDIHNAALFLGIQTVANANTLEMKWAIDYSGNPLGAPATIGNACHLSLVFRNPSFVLVLPRNEKLPLEEETCIAGISKVIPVDATNPKTAEYRVRAEWDEHENFNLLFVFQSGRSIEIGADAVELLTSV